MKDFNSESEAKEAAKAEINNILNDKQSINPDKFSQLLNSYRKSQIQYDSEINVAISSQVDNILTTKELVEASNSNIIKLKQEFEELNEFWQENIEFHRDMEVFQGVLWFRKNIKMTLDQMNDYTNMSIKINELKNIYTSPAYFEYIQNQIFMLKELKDNISRKLDGDSLINTQTRQQLLSQFTILDDFESEFYAFLFTIIEETIENATTKPNLLKKAVKTIAEADIYLENKGELKIYHDKIKELLNEGIRLRFLEKIGDIDQADIVMEKIQFTIDDLVIVIDYVVPCYPSTIDVFSIFEEAYKNNVEKIMRKFLEDEQRIQQSPGDLLLFSSWIDQYETMLRKRGSANADYLNLKIIIGEKMRFFLDDIGKFISERAVFCIEPDRKVTSDELLDKFEKNKGELISTFPIDLFQIINTQISLYQNRVKGDPFIEIIRVWTEFLSEFQEREMERMQLRITPDDQIIVVLYINNYYKCIEQISQTRDHIINTEPEEIGNRVLNLMNQTIRKFGDSIDKMLKMAARYCFSEIQKRVLHFFFTLDWNENNHNITTCLITLDDYIQSLETWYVSSVHFAKTVILIFERLIELYFKNFVFIVSKTFKNSSKDIIETLINEIDREKGAKHRYSTDFLSKTDTLIEKMKADLKEIIEKIKSNYSAIVKDTVIARFQKKFECFFKLLQDPLFVIQEDVGLLFENFGNMTRMILEAILNTRSDCNSKFKESTMKYCENFIVSKS